MKFSIEHKLKLRPVYNIDYIESGDLLMVVSETGHYDLIDFELYKDAPVFYDTYQFSVMEYHTSLDADLNRVYPHTTTANSYSNWKSIGPGKVYTFISYIARPKNILINLSVQYNQSPVLAKCNCFECMHYPHAQTCLISYKSKLYITKAKILKSSNIVEPVQEI